MNQHVLMTLKDGRSPRVDESVFLAPDCRVIGEVEIGRQSSVWFGSIIRGDVHWIKIGERTNVQDLSMLHVTYKTHPLSIGNDVTIGHRVTLHGCAIGDRVLIGMGATIMDGAKVNNDAFIAAGALLTPNTEVPSGVLMMGNPARVKRELKPEEKEFLKISADNYVKYQEMYS